MTKYLFLIPFIPLFSSCRDIPQPEPQVVSSVNPGFYESSRLEYLERINLKMQGIKRYATGFKLTLNQDATYQMISCGCISKGQWRSDATQLYLQETDINWRLDTFRKHGFKGKWPEVSKEPMVFTVKNKRIYSTYPDKSIIIMDYKGAKPVSLSKFYYVSMCDHPFKVLYRLHSDVLYQMRSGLNLSRF